MQHWLAPAKLNLFLHVIGRRADGYHDLQTAFQLLDWGDEIGMAVDGSGVIERQGGVPGLPAEQDLTVRAARLLQAFAPARGVRLQVRKRVPVGGGLGGGSSDAATVLLVLNKLWGLDFPPQRLLELGASLGSDLPVFIAGQSAWAEGRGERLTPLELPEQWFVIVHPRVSVSTAEIFQAPELTRNSPVLTIRALSPAEARNDCEAVVRARFPAVGDALDWLSQFGSARLTGTGACVFAGFPHAAAAERVAARTPEEWRSFVARGVNRSPLHGQLAGLG